jgi:transcriptional regulator with XRE-family HTH domain
MNTTSKFKQIWESLRDPEFRKQLIDEHMNVGIAFQVRSLRDRQKLTQTELAELLGDKRKQPLISQWENPNYGKYTLATLKDLAKVFDVGLLVRFVPFSTLVDWTINLTSDVIAPPSFGEEQYRVTASVSAASNLAGDTQHLDANNPPHIFDMRLQKLRQQPTSPTTATEKELIHA